ncbi:MAG: hypothetical protein A2143_04315 [Gallionellales bacterium RBG_16_57_15]|nr:MAG: hypothetical protein A2143_04315 [Gallionellales bacterium RBG_16_57_15]
MGAPGATSIDPRSGEIDKDRQADLQTIAFRSDKLSVSDTNGSTARSPLFAASAGDELVFNFNFVTFDGADYVPITVGRLLDLSSSVVALLFTARTTPAGNSVPRFGMLIIDAF